MNYGHTFGQSIESYYGLYQDALRHGEAVALGMIVAGKLSDLLGITTNSLAEETIQVLKQYRLPTKFDDVKAQDRPSAEVLIKNLINDKKRTSKGNRFILCTRIGCADVISVEESKQNLIKKAFDILYR